MFNTAFVVALFDWRGSALGRVFFLVKAVRDARTSCTSRHPCWHSDRPLRLLGTCRRLGALAGSCRRPQILSSLHSAPLSLFLLLWTCMPISPPQKPSLVDQQHVTPHV